MMLLVAAALACDVVALEKLATELPDEPTPLDVGPGIAAACPRPVGLNRALRKPGDLHLDLSSAVNQAANWIQICEGGLEVLPDGFAEVTPGERQALWSTCGLARYEAFEYDEWVGTTGPSISVVLLADLLTKAKVSPEARTTLLRTWANIPDRIEAPHSDGVELTDPDPLSGFRETAPARAVTLAAVKWPPGVDLESICLVDVHIVSDGTPSKIEWVACPEELQSYIRSAIEASWFQPGRKKGRPVHGEVRLRYAPSSKAPSVGEAK